MSSNGGNIIIYKKGGKSQSSENTFPTKDNRDVNFKINPSLT